MLRTDSVLVFLLYVLVFPKYPKLPKTRRKCEGVWGETNRALTDMICGRTHLLATEGLSLAKCMASPWLQMWAAQLSTCVCISVAS